MLGVRPGDMMFHGHIKAIIDGRYSVGDGDGARQENPHRALRALPRPALYFRVLSE